MFNNFFYGFSNEVLYYSALLEPILNSKRANRAPRVHDNSDQNPTLRFSANSNNSATPRTIPFLVFKIAFVVSLSLLNFCIAK